MASTSRQRGQITLSVSGVNSLVSRIKRQGQAASDELSREVKATALDMRSEVIKMIQKGPKTGEIYKRGNVEHRASAPGEPPATDRGTLVSSIYFKPINRWAVQLGSRLDRAYWLEFGTKRIKKRPAWVPTVKKYRPILADRAEAIYRKHMRKK